jgi:hypothetical protein
MSHSSLSPRLQFWTSVSAAVAGAAIIVLLFLHETFPTFVEGCIDWVQARVEFQHHPLLCVIAFFLPAWAALYYRITSVVHRLSDFADKLDDVANVLGVQSDRVNSLALGVRTLHAAIQDSSITIVHLNSEPELFSGFVGEFCAINAPMLWEHLFLHSTTTDSVKTHYLRYVDPRFELANYYYPIFAFLSEGAMAQWTTRIYRFFFHLQRAIVKRHPDREAEDHVLHKLQFWIPKAADGSAYFRGSYHSTMTSFAGIKGKIEHVVFYHSITMFSSCAEMPDMACVCYNQEFYARTMELALGLSNDSVRLTLDEFLSHLQSNMRPEDIESIQTEVGKYIASAPWLNNSQRS